MDRTNVIENTLPPAKTGEVRSLDRMEVIRKMIHLGTLVIPWAIHYGGMTERTILQILVPVTVFIVAIDLLRLRFRRLKKIHYRMFGYLLRRGEVHRLTSASTMFISATLCVFFFEPMIVFLSLSFAAIGDTMAALVGKHFGRIRLPGSHHKTLEGSAACLVSSFTYAFYFVDPVPAAIGAITATIAEAMYHRVDDNLKIPLASSLVLYLYTLIPGVAL